MIQPEVLTSGPRVSSVLNLITLTGLSNHRGLSGQLFELFLFVGCASFESFPSIEIDAFLPEYCARILDN